MITEGQQKAICRIWVDGTKTRGTGFLIADDAVLTAAHVVRSSANPNAHHSGDVELRFADDQRFTVPNAKVDGAQFNAADDWAIVRLPEGTRVPGATRFHALPLPAENGLEWRTFGYSAANDLTKDAGLAYWGTVGTSSPHPFQIGITSTKDLVAGLSGSPCLVDGHVVGVIVRSLDNNPSDTLYVLPVQRIKSSALSMLPSDAPYARDVQARIAAAAFEPYLAQVAAKLGLARSKEEAKAAFGAGRLVQRCAIAMMGGVDPAFTALKTLKSPCRDQWLDHARARAAELLHWAGSAWIPSGAVEQLAQALSDNQLVVLNSDKSQLAESYVHRAGCLEDSPPGAFAPLVTVDSAAASDEELLNAFNEAVEADQQLNPDGTGTAAQLLEKYRHHVSPIVALFFGLPPRTAVNRIRQAGTGYDKVRLLFLVGSTTPAKLDSEYDDATVIEPAPQAQDVALRHQALKKALDDLHDVFP